MTAALLDHPALPVDELTRRGLLAGAGALSALLALSGCGTAVAPAADVGRAPTPIAHKYGETLVPVAPERVVCLGFTDHDYLLALGLSPVAISSYEYTAGPGGYWPWTRSALGDARPQILTPAEVNLEAVAALRPDLITGFASGITEQEYGLLSRIAPTVAQPVGQPDFFAPWQELTRIAGLTVGRAERAEELIAQVERRFAAARAANPAFEDAVAVYAAPLASGGYYAETERSSRVEILTSLGFTVPGEITALAGDETFAPISPERLDLLDRDVLVWELSSPEARPAIEKDPLYRILEVAREGRDVFIEAPVLAGAMAFISVLSLPIVVDELVPRLAAALDGDPATAVPR